jgi:non-ribosomal peptide synthetase component F
LGEIYIGGAGVAHGYRNLPDLTAERFLENPFRIAPGARMYRTGDLGRILTDCQTAFCGRIDAQKKFEPTAVCRALGIEVDIEKRR